MDIAITGLSFLGFLFVIFSIVVVVIIAVRFGIEVGEIIEDWFFELKEKHKKKRKAKK